MIETHLLKAFLYAAKRDLGYKDFFLAVAAVGGAPAHADRHLTAMLRELVQLASRSPPGWRIPRNAILVDGLGLAEAYFIYRSLAAAGVPPAVDVGVNLRGDTYGFKQRLGVENMIQASQKLEELTLFTSIDKAVHSLPSMPAEKLASAMERAVAERLRLIAEEALRRRASIATDHAYDVVCAQDGCRLCHGPRCPGALSKLAVALLMG